MGIIKIEESEMKELQKHIAERTTNLSTITNEITAYFAQNPKAKTLTYDLSEYVLAVSEPERNKRFRLYATEIQQKTRIKVSRILHNGKYVLILDKTKPIEQPKQLIGKIGKNGKQQ